MMMLMLAHRYVECAENIREKVRYEPMGTELEGRTLGIIGFGSSGTELARRARAFGMRIRGIDVRLISQEILEEIQPEFIGGPADADQVASALLTRGVDLPPPPENPMSADRVRWEHIQRVYEQCDRNVSETARRLNMHRRTLQRILAKRAPRETNIPRS